MPDTKTWISTDGNWNTTTSWSPTGVPVATDDVYFVSGSQDVTTNPATPVVLGSLNFGTKWTGSIATACEMSATTLDYANKIGTVILEGVFVTVNVQATASDNPALKFQDCTITTMLITGGSGTIFVNTGTTISGSISIIGATSARLEVEAGATVSAADVTIDSGKITTYEELDTIVQYGGSVTMLNATGVTNSISMYKGIMKYKPTGASTLTALTIFSGYFDMRGCNSPSHTITNATIYSGGMLDERNGLANTVYTNPVLSNGGVFMPDLGRNITVT